MVYSPHFGRGITPLWSALLTGAWTSFTWTASHMHAEQVSIHTVQVSRANFSANKRRSAQLTQKCIHSFVVLWFCCVMFLVDLDFVTYIYIFWCIFVQISLKLKLFKILKIASDWMRSKQSAGSPAQANERRQPIANSPTITIRPSLPQAVLADVQQVLLRRASARDWSLGPSQTHV